MHWSLYITKELLREEKWKILELLIIDDLGGFVYKKSVL